MKKITLAALLALMACMPLSAQKQTIQQESIDLILKEVTSIRTQQMEEALRRQEAVERRMKRDSANANTEADLKTDYDMMGKIEENTHKEFFLDGWNLYGGIAIIIAVISAVVSCITYRAQKETERHTSNAPLTVQLQTLKDLPRHFYRNLVCSCAIILKYRKTNSNKSPRDFYPSESNLRKLQVLPDDVALPIDIDTKTDAANNPYRHMHELKLLLRNYNIEVETASKHLMVRNISEESLSQDFDNLLFKPLYLVKRSFEYEKSLTAGGKDLARRAVCTLLMEHFLKLSEPQNFHELLETDAESVLKMLDKIGISFKDNIDKKEGVKRSVENLLGNQASVKRVEVLSEVARMMPDKSNFLKAIVAIDSKEALCSFYEKFYNKGADTVALERLYEKMKPYFNYLKQKEYTMSLLLEYMLVVDATIEMDRIGMVNFD